jgi:hypothetical protein
MNLGMAKKQLGEHSDEVPDAEAARELAGARDRGDHLLLRRRAAG